MTTLSIIVALDENNAIGEKNNLLCYLPNDLKHFKSITVGHTVIMGRKTFESLPKGALPNRRNIVISGNPHLQFDNCEMCNSIEAAIQLCQDQDEVFIIGGGLIYEATIDRVCRLYITRIHHLFEDADTFFPNIDTTQWQEISRKEQEADEKNAYRHTFIQLDKIKPQ